MKAELKQLGVVGVDSGQLIITDPCYIDSLPNYKKLCDINGQVYFRDGHPAAGVKIEDFGGDGIFPVFGEYDKDGLLVKVVIDLERS